MSILFSPIRIKCKSCGRKFTFNNHACDICHKIDFQHCYQCHNSISNCNYKYHMDKKRLCLNLFLYTCLTATWMISIGIIFGGVY